MFNMTCQACKDYVTSGGSLTDDQLLSIYAFFKQATIGDINIMHPSDDDRRAWAKFYAWRTVRGMSKADAMTAYVRVARLYGIN